MSFSTVLNREGHSVCWSLGGIGGRRPIAWRGFGLDELDEVRRFQPPKIGGLLPVRDGFAPAALLLSQLGHGCLVLGFVPAGFDD